MHRLLDQPPIMNECWDAFGLNLAAGDHRVGRPASCYINSEKKNHIFLVFTKKPYIFQYLQTSYWDMKITEKPFKLISNKIKILCFTTKNDGTWETANDSFKTPSSANALAYALASCRY